LKDNNVFPSEDQHDAIDSKNKIQNFSSLSLLLVNHGICCDQDLPSTYAQGMAGTIEGGLEQASFFSHLGTPKALIYLVL